jgi:hypothetical protein
MTEADGLRAALAAALPALAADRPTVVVDSPDFPPGPIAVAGFLAEGDPRGAAEATETVRVRLARRARATPRGMPTVTGPRG